MAYHNTCISFADSVSVGTVSEICESSYKFAAAEDSLFNSYVFMSKSLLTS